MGEKITVDDQEEGNMEDRYFLVFYEIKRVLLKKSIKTFFINKKFKISHPPSSKLLDTHYIFP